MTKIAIQEWAAMDYNGRILDELPPDYNGYVSAGCNGLLWEDF